MCWAFIMYTAAEAPRLLTTCWGLWLQNSVLAVLRSDQARVERLVQDAVGQLTAAASASSVQVSRTETDVGQSLVCCCLPEQNTCALSWPVGCMHDGCFCWSGAVGVLCFWSFSGSSWLLIVFLCSLVLA